jgi:CMP-N-acetylneuraminic acid synthetase
MADKEILAIIPARGGSKRVPRKNVLMLGGKPLIAHTIAHAKQSKYITRVIVSTDDEETAKVAKEYGAEVPFMRPAELAQDMTPDLPVFQHALKWLKENEGYEPAAVVQLRPTSPLRKVEDVDAAIELLLAHPEVDSVRTVIEAEPSPYKMYVLEGDGLLAPLLAADKGYINMPTQALPKAYRHIGTADVIWPKTLLDKNHMSGTKILPYFVKEAYTGIDTPQNWEYYEFIFSRRQ